MNAVIVLLAVIAAVMLFGREAVLSLIQGAGGIVLLLVILVAGIIAFLGGLALLDKYIFSPIAKFLEPASKLLRKWEKWFYDLGALKQYGFFALSLIGFFLLAWGLFSLYFWVSGF